MVFGQTHTHVSYFGSTGTPGDVSSGFQTHSGFCLICMLQASVMYIHSLRSTSGATPANLLAASIAASHFPTCISRGGTWLRFEWAITCTEDKHGTIVPVTRLILWLFKSIIQRKLFPKALVRIDLTLYDKVFITWANQTAIPIRLRILRIQDFFWGGGGGK